MPQISPILWGILFFTFSATLLSFNAMNYFSVPSTAQTSNGNHPTNNTLAWKW